MMRVLVFPSCNEPGLEVLDALRTHPRVLLWGASSVDPAHDPSRGLLGPRHASLPMLGEPGFDAALRALIQRARIDYVFLTVDALVAALAGQELGATIIGPSPEVAAVALSKSRTLERLQGVVPLPRSADHASPESPAFAKPPIGSGSRGVRLIHSTQALEEAQGEGLLVQELLPGAEYTVDCVGDPRGQLLASSVRKREEVSAGIARTSRCVDHPLLSAHVAAIAVRLPIAGPWFAQFREDAEGVPRLLEVNARVGGSSGVSRLAGVNTPLLSLLSFAGHTVTAPRRMSGVRVHRRLDRAGSVSDFDVVIWDLDDTLVRGGQRVIPESAAWLYRFKNQGKRQLLLSRNPEPQAVIERVQLPGFFEEVISTDDKLAELRRWLANNPVPPERVILINDSGSERIQLDRELPALRTVSPDALDVLSRLEADDAGL